MWGWAVASYGGGEETLQPSPLMLRTLSWLFFLCLDLKDAGCTAGLCWLRLCDCSTIHVQLTCVLQHGR